MRRRDSAKKGDKAYDVGSTTNQVRHKSKTNERIVGRSFTVAALAIDIARQKAQHSFFDIREEMKKAVHHANPKTQKRMDAWAKKLAFEKPIRSLLDVKLHVLFQRLLVISLHFHTV
jgi:hypothetical protein